MSMGICLGMTKGGRVGTTIRSSPTHVDLSLSLSLQSKPVCASLMSHIRPLWFRPLWFKENESKPRPICLPGGHHSRSVSRSSSVFSRWQQIILTSLSFPFFLLPLIIIFTRSPHPWGCAGIETSQILYWGLDITGRWLLTMSSIMPWRTPLSEGNFPRLLSRLHFATALYPLIFDSLITESKSNHSWL